MGFFVGVERALAQRDQNVLASKKLKMQEDELRLNRRLSLVDAFHKKNLSASKPIKGYEDNVMIESDLYLNNLIKQASENNEYDDTTKNFITKIQSDAHAIVDLVKFLKNQASDKDRIFKLNELPTIVSIIDNPNQTKREKFDLFKELELVDLTDEDDFVDLYKKVMDIDTTDFGSRRNVFITTPTEMDIDQTRSITLEQKQLDSISKRFIPSAQKFIQDNLNSQDSNIRNQVIETQSALDNLDNKNLQSKSMATLLKYYLEPKFIYDIVRDKNFIGIEKSGAFRDQLALNGIIIRNKNVTMDKEITQNLANIDSRLQNYVGQVVTFIYDPTTNTMQPDI
jgi:hypothetical protein